jgi:hypothetical protein
MDTRLLKLSAVPKGRSVRLLSLLEEVETGAGELSAGEAIEALGRAVRVEAVLRCRYAALAAPSAPPQPTAKAPESP